METPYGVRAEKQFREDFDAGGEVLYLYIGAWNYNVEEVDPSFRKIIAHIRAPVLRPRQPFISSVPPKKRHKHEQDDLLDIGYPITASG